MDSIKAIRGLVIATNELGAVIKRIKTLTSKYDEASVVYDILFDARLSASYRIEYIAFQFDVVSKNSIDIEKLKNICDNRDLMRETLENSIDDIVSSFQNSLGELSCLKGQLDDEDNIKGKKIIKEIDFDSFYKYFQNVASSR